MRATILIVLLACSDQTSTDGGAMESGGATEAGGLDCGASMLCGDACVDVTSDMMNCGRCDHDCLGGDCKAGICQPVVIAQMQHDQCSSLVVDANRAYWVNQVYGVMQVPIAGGSVTVVPGTENGMQFDMRLALDNNYVYWTATTTTGGALRLAPKMGGMASDVYTFPYGADRLALRGSRLAWSWANNIGCQILDGDVTGGTQKTLATVPGGAMTITGLAMDDTDVYWTDTTRVVRVSTSGGSPTVLAQGTSPSSVAVDGTNGYWLDNGAVMACAKNGCKPAMLASGTSGGSLAELATDGSYVYWTDSNPNGSVMRVPVGGGASSTVASGQKTPTRIALDATAVYWIAALGGGAYANVMRVAKP